MSNSKFQHPLTWYATHYAVSIATVKRWSARGLNLDDPHVIEWEVIGQKHEPPNLQTRPKAGHSGAKPYEQRVSIEQRLYDFLVYVNGVDPLVASKAASLVFSSNLKTHLKMTEDQEFSPENPHGCDRLFSDDVGGRFGTWMVPEEALAKNLDEVEWTPAQAKKYLKQAADIDREDLRREGLIK